jgi:Na+-translocating ferredoxin:NAD+ oxidoreductase RnfC subunit
MQHSMPLDKDQPVPAPSTIAEASDLPGFQPLRATGRLKIPIAANGRLSADAIVPKPAGTKVRRGEILAEKWPQMSPAPLAPLDGCIVGAMKAKLSTRATLPAIEFEPDSTAPVQEFIPSASAEAIRQMLHRLGKIGLAAGIERLLQCGVWADRWTCPDLLGQLRACAAKKVDIVLCNLLDESTDLLLHGELAGPFAMELAAGTLALAAIAGAQRAWAVMAAFGDPAVWEALRYAADGTSLKVVPLRDHYPQAHPSLLIHELTGRHVRPGRLPCEAGVLTLDAPAAIAVGRCFLNHEPMLAVPVGLHDKRNKTTHWLSVPIGMPWSQVLSQLSIADASIELRAGSPLRELRISADCIVSGGELSLTAIAVPRLINPDPCIRCAWCVEGCPVRIQPAGLLEAAQQDDPFLADQYGLDACIECGICTYVCPSHLPILAGIRALRASNAAEAGRSEARKYKTAAKIRSQNPRNPNQAQNPNEEI